MAILARKVDGIWRRWQGQNTPFERTVSTYNAHFADGRVVEMSCEPYLAPAQLSSDAVEHLVDDGTWTSADLDLYCLKVAVPFTAPSGKQIAGDAAYVEQEDGSVTQVYPVEDVPPPPERTPAEKLAALAAAQGMTVEELKRALAAS